MEAKDTVMSAPEIDTRLCNYANNFDEGDMAQIQKIVTLQAEISFEAGFVEGQADKGHNEAILRVANESRKAGRKEVVEW